MKAHIVSLGCPKNLVDTEALMSSLASEGYSFTDKPKEADLILVNTCAFLQSAKEEAISTIKNLAKWKKKGKCRYLIAAGCLPQRYKNECPELLPEVDAFIGTPNLFYSEHRTQNSEHRTQGRSKHPEISAPSSVLSAPNKIIIKATPPWYAYVKIAEGCDNRCSYCVVPTIRGPLRIRPMKDILAEVRLLARTGVKEIILVAQDTSVYPHLPHLLRSICRNKGIRWVRLMYAHPAHVTNALINVIAKEKKVVKYLDLPIQHASDKILRLMKRRYERQDLENLITKIRRKIPKIALRTSVIVGFPGEGEAEFGELLAFLARVKFDRLGVFTYSREPGTPASQMRGQVPERVKQRRFHRLMRQQRRIAHGSNQKMIGQSIPTIIERSVQGGYWGRSYLDAPEIDGRVFVRSTKSIRPGGVVQVRVTKAKTYDLIGTLT